jgi:hypothetical protein
MIVIRRSPVESGQQRRESPSTSPPAGRSRLDARPRPGLRAHGAQQRLTDDVSADIGIKSKSDGALKRVLSRKIKEADVLLVIVGEKTHRRQWVVWEVEKALELGKRIVAVKIESTYESPKELLGVGVKWAKSFDYKAIKAVMEE